MLHLHGVGMKQALKRLPYFENEQVYSARIDYALSNIDLFERLLKEEEQVFTTRGGSSYFNLPEGEEKQMHELLSDVVFGQSLRQWVRNFGLNAYRADPMGVIFMEVEKVTAIEGKDNKEAGKPLEYDIETPKCYPTYKCSQDVWEYQCNGRRLDYICFALTNDELIMYGITEQSTTVYPNPSDAKPPVNKQYFRWVDDSQDVILKLEVSATISSDGSTPQVTVLKLDGVDNPIKGLWNKVPAFIVSDLIRFTDPATFDTPLRSVIELADAFLYDRSINLLTKKYHGFPKAVEPLLQCTMCGGEGYKDGHACNNCTIPGHDKGTGYQLQTKVSDVAKFPIEILNKDAAPNFNYKNIFGYVTPDIEGINMQIDGLRSLEELMFITYWTKNNNQIQGFNGKQDTKETATQVLTDLQGKYARLNTTADWAEQTERMIANLIGEFWFNENYKGANISYGRNYILETPDTVLDTYYNMKANGVPDSMLDNQYEKYINCLWQSNPIQANIYRKKFDTEPFPHLSAEEVEKSEFVLEEDKLCKRYFGEWDDSITDAEWTFKDVKILKQSLKNFAKEKQTALDADVAKDTERQAALTAATTKPIAA
ncbi:MAG: hypothetical protein K0Q79_2754 [Flavipsychrobacter sp.]|nr:hypothetical protein [Flavipsychrobacter sp.]